MPAEKSAIRSLASFSSESTTVAGSPVMASSRFAYARAVVLSDAMTRPPASGTWRRTSVSRWSAACSTAGIQSPSGDRAVRQACAVMSFVVASPRLALISSPAEVRQRIAPL